MMRASQSASNCMPRILRFIFLGLFIIMWLDLAGLNFTRPDPVTRKRFFAPALVFIFGIFFSLIRVLTGDGQAAELLKPAIDQRMATIGGRKRWNQAKNVENRESGRACLGFGRDIAGLVLLPREVEPRILADAHDVGIDHGFAQRFNINRGVMGLGQ